MRLPRRGYRMFRNPPTSKACGLAIVSRHLSPPAPHATAAYCLLNRAILMLSIVWLVASAPTAAAQTGEWARQGAGTLARLHSVFFLDQKRGWIVGSKGTLLATVDGGVSWKIKPRPTEDALRDIHFSDELNGWVV
ncbi:MAG: WD40/YVTN/BNR-like repeat-containing protein, partial [Pyrinomonadaceae bacterium]